MEMKDNAQLSAINVGLTSDQAALDILYEYQKALSESRHSPEKIEKKRREVTLMCDRVF